MPKGGQPPTYLKACQLSDIPSFKFLCTLFKVVWAQNQPFTTKTNENTKFAPLWEGGANPIPPEACQLYSLHSSKYLYTLFWVVWAQNQPFTTKTNENTKFAPLWEGGANPIPPEACQLYSLHSSKYLYTLFWVVWAQNQPSMTKTNETLPHAEKGGPRPP